MLAAVLLMPGMAFASYTLEGCRNGGSISLPNGDGNFICPDAAYTTGNLGKGWNELDLVPFRVTVTNSGTYAFAIVLDNSNGGHLGYDVISAPVLNTTLSVGTCSAASSGPQSSVSGINGVDTSIYRVMTITQSAGSSCVYDWYGRLALGSHEFSGASLHANLLNAALAESGIGNKEVSIPVRELSPQSLSKDMAATVNSSFVWNLTKSGDPTEVSFGDVCASDTPTPPTVAITIAWTKSAAVLGKVNITTNVYATNPASRTIETHVTDVIYKGSDQSTPLDTSGPVTAHVGAGQTVLVMTHTVALDASVAGGIGDSLNDVATATYIDDVTGIPIPGDESTTASTVIKSGSSSDGTADLTDTESISGTGLSFSVAAPSVGSFSGYSAGDETIGPVDWSALAQSASGSVTFNKTIYLDSPLAGDLGTLSDTANLYSPNQSTPDQSLEKSLDVAINSTATVKLTVSKTIPANYPGAFLNQSGDLLKVHFHVAGALGYSNDFTLAFDSSTSCDLSGCTLSKELSGLTPDTFTVTETSSELCPLGTCTDPATNSFLQPASNPLQKDLTIPVNKDMTGRCSGTVAFTNILNAQGVKAEVEKVTAPELASDDPDYLWTFTLNGPNVSTCLPATVGAGAGFLTFTDSSGVDPCLLSDGDYTVTETTKTGWQQDSATPNDGVDTLVCAFSVNLITDDGKTFSCTFHNTRLGHASVIKTVLGLPPGATDSFEFQLREGASLSSVGTILPGQDLFANAGNGGVLNFTADLVPGNSYQLCEIVMPGWVTTLSPTFVPNGNDPAADNSVQCVDFTVNAGETKTFTVDNTPPPGGNARTIGFWRNWSACHRSRGHQEDVLGETLTLADPTGIEYGSHYLHSGDGCYAVNLLSKSQMTTGTKMPGDAIFNMTAQLIAAELNIVAGASTCPAVTTAIGQANTLLIKYSFNGDSYHPTLTKADRQLANSLGATLDMYNNNELCP